MVLPPLFSNRPPMTVPFFGTKVQQRRLTDSHRAGAIRAVVLN